VNLKRGSSINSFYLRKKCFFVDLFVRVSNEVAVNMYKRLGYVVYRRVLDYYSGDPDEDAFGKNSLKLVVIFFKLKKVILIYHT
jgi:hypothetical protein